MIQDLQDLLLGTKLLEENARYDVEKYLDVEKISRGNIGYYFLNETRKIPAV